MSISANSSCSIDAFHERFGAMSVRLPLLRNENEPVSRMVVPTGGTCRASPTGTSHIRSRAPGGAATSCSSACGG